MYNLIAGDSSSSSLIGHEFDPFQAHVARHRGRISRRHQRESRSYIRVEVLLEENAPSSLTVPYLISRSILFSRAFHCELGLRRRPHPQVRVQTAVGLKVTGNAHAKIFYREVLLEDMSEKEGGKASPPRKDRVGHTYLSSIYICSPSATRRRTFQSLRNQHVPRRDSCGEQ